MNQTSDVRAMMDVVNEVGEARNCAMRIGGVCRCTLCPASRREALGILADALEEAGNDTLAVRLRMVAEAGFWPEMYTGQRCGWFRSVTPAGHLVDANLPQLAYLLLPSGKMDPCNCQQRIYDTAADALVALATVLAMVSESDALDALQHDRSTVS